MTTWFDVLGLASLSLLPAAATVAVLRYRLYEIDRIVSRTIGWAVISAVLLVVFAVAVVALQTVLSGFTGGDTIPVALSTLLAFGVVPAAPARRPGRGGPAVRSGPPRCRGDGAAVRR